MRKYLYIIFCFGCIFLTACNADKNLSNNYSSDAQKLISSQVLNNDIVHEYPLIEGFKYKNTNDSLSLPTSTELPLISIKSISHKIDFHAKRIKFTELPVLLQSRLNKMISVPLHISAIYSPASDSTENPYLAPTISFLGMSLIAVYITFTGYSLTGAGGVFLGVFGGVGTLLFLILCLVNQGKSDYTKERATSYGIAWIFSLIYLLFSFLFLVVGSSSLAMMTYVLTIMLIVYFVKWINSLEDLKWIQPEKAPVEKHHNWLAALFLIGAIGSLIFALAVSYDTGLLIASAMVLFAGFYVLWMLQLKPRPRETVFFVSFLLLALIGILNMPSISYGPGSAYLVFLLAALVFLILWIKNLKYWSKSNTD